MGYKVLVLIRSLLDPVLKQRFEYDTIHGRLFSILDSLVAVEKCLCPTDGSVDHQAGITSLVSKQCADSLYLFLYSKAGDDVFFNYFFQNEKSMVCRLSHDVYKVIIG